MQPYTIGFAEVYDVLMDHISYEDWADYIEDLLHKDGIQNGLVLELGCGTGKMTRLMAQKGYDMIGIDNSEDMLSIARECNDKEELDILYLCQDMREFELYGTVKAVISVCDSMNYILTEEELLKVFTLVNNYLDPKGLFIFDLSTIYAYEEVMGDTTYAVNRPEGTFIWENTYYPEEEINEVNLTLFVPNKDGLFEKREEEHTRRGYTLDTIRQLIEKAGLQWVNAIDEESKGEAHEESERVYVIAREKYHEGKTYTNA